MNRSVEQVFDQPFQTNLCFTPVGGPGIQPHNDTVAAYVVLITGSMHWRVYDPFVHVLEISAVSRPRPAGGS